MILNIALQSFNQPRSVVDQLSIFVRLHVIALTLSFGFAGAIAAFAEEQAPPDFQYKFAPKSTHSYSCTVEDDSPDGQKVQLFEMTIHPFDFKPGQLAFGAEWSTFSESGDGAGKSRTGGGSAERLFECDPTGRRIPREKIQHGSLMPMNARRATPELAINEPMTLFVMPLPSKPASEWEFERDCEYLQQASMGRGYLAMRHLQSSEVFPASNVHETFRFKLLGRTDQTINVQFDYTVKQTERNASGLSYGVTGKGDYVFDFKEGVIESVTFNGTETEENNSRKLKIEIRQKGMSSQTAKETDTAMQWNAKKVEMTATLCDASLKDLVSGNVREQRIAIANFYEHAPNAKKDAVIAALKSAQEKVPGPQKFWCLSAIGNWGGKASVEYLTPLLESKDSNIRFGAAEGLTRTNDTDALKRVTVMLSGKKTSALIARYLIRVGPTAEPIVAPLLGDPRELVRLRACEILGAIGNKSTIELLNGLRLDADEDVKAASKAAIKKIKNRSK